MKFERGKIIEKLEITGISAEGKGVGRKDNLVIFVNESAPGDVMDVQVTGKEKKFLLAKPANLIIPSPDRDQPFCRHFGTCGGCKWQHMSYEAQLKHKQNHVADNLRKISGISLPDINPILGSANTTFYRNKLEYTFSNSRWLTTEEIQTGNTFSRNAVGFHIPKMFDKILDIDKCYLQTTSSNQIRNAIRDFALEHSLSFYDLKDQVGLMRNLIIRTTSTLELMVIVQFGENDPRAIELVMFFLKNEFPEITALLYIINEKKNETFFDLPVHTYAGKDFIEEKMGKLSFRIGPKSFYQTNSLQAHELYKKTLEYAELTGSELVYDLYTGTGTIANFVARDAKKVVGIESVPEAVADAKLNAKNNNILNTQFFAGDMKDMLTGDFIKKHGKPDVIITDPPRAGMHKNVIEALLELKAKRIIYVSCNPATQARDLADLAAAYDVDVIQPVDMFPHTHHVENIIRLNLK